MKKIVIEQVFNSFWLGRTRRDLIEAICFDFATDGYKLISVTSKKARRYFLFPTWVTLLFFEKEE